MPTFRANGKLLISGEYVVLDGATAFAIPTQLGQTLKVKMNSSGVVQWNAFLGNDMLWNKATFSLKNFDLITNTNPDFGKRLEQILKAVSTLNPNFCLAGGAQVNTHLEFPQDWGLGSSSTLISLVAQWSEVDPYPLLEKTFGGSGYDIACARSNTPILYNPTDKPRHTTTSFDLKDKKSLYFVHLNQKQNSRSGIKSYKSIPLNKELLVQIDEISKRLPTLTNQNDFCAALNEHEKRIAEHLDTPTVKKRLFSDFEGTVKSLGAWGGDFVLAVGAQGTADYFRNKGFKTILQADELLLL